MLSQDWSASYDRIVWVDSDILINLTAPDVINDTPEEKIGCVDEFAYPTPKDHKAIMAAGCIQPVSGDAEVFHTCAGLPAARHIVQTGVMVLSPRHHRKLFEHTYNTHEDAGTDRYYEMRFLSHEIQKVGVQHWINPRFNALLIWLALADIVKTGRQPTNKLEMGYFLMEQFFRNFFIHFGGHHDWMSLVGFMGG